MAARTTRQSQPSRPEGANAADRSTSRTRSRLIAEPERRYGGQRITRLVQDSGVTGEPPDIYCYAWPLFAKHVKIPSGDDR
jgi:hypothetical protein